MGDRWLQSLSATNFRCFRDTGELDVRPVNILVGENSSGKSTLLALSRIVTDYLGRQDIPFNRAPFFLGSYNEIAFNIGGKLGRTPSFTIGCRVKLQAQYRPKKGSGQSVNAEVRITFVNSKSQPTVSGLHIELSKTEFIDIQASSDFVRISSSMNEESFDQKISLIDANKADFPSQSLFDFFFKAQALLSQQSGQQKKTALRAIEAFIYPVLFFNKRAYAPNPIRGHPQRTYDSVPGNVRSGDYALQELALLKRTREQKWKEFKQDIEKAGKETKLFKGFDIRLLGKNESDPFQTSVKIGGSRRNVVDVGFGVSQMIPIFYDLSISSFPLILIQQPETHLHPAAQAGLGGLLAALPKLKPDQVYFVETHSDYLIDAIGVAIREQRCDAGDFAVWYTEKGKGESVIHQMHFDKSGVITDQPSSYRQFFLSHQAKLLGIEL